MGRPKKEEYWNQVTKLGTIPGSATIVDVSLREVLLESKHMWNGLKGKAYKYAKDPLIVFHEKL